MVNFRGILADLFLWGIPSIFIVGFLLSLMLSEYNFIHSILMVIFGWKLGCIIADRNVNGRK